MLRMNFAVSVLGVGAMVLTADGVHGQAYPSKPIRFVTGAPGGAVDLVTRLIGEGISKALGQPVTVDNRGGGVISTEIVSKAAPDGYTLLVFSGSVWTAPLFQKVSYDPVKDFAPITLATMSPQLLVAHSSVPVKSVKELIALAKARPGELNYAVGIAGSGSYLASQLFNSMAGINIVLVPYKSGAAQLTDLLSGQVQLTFTTPDAAIKDYVKTGRLRGLAVSSAKPSPLIPGLPTVASAVPGYESGLTIAMFAPAKTPDAIIKRLYQEAVGFLKTASTKERLFEASIEAIGSTPEELAAKVKSEMILLGKVIKTP